MVKSMTGYGKSECLLGGDKYLIEVRSLNGKNSDITIKTSLIPRENEMEVRQFITQSLNRGNIDLFATVENNDPEVTKQINKEILIGYYNQIKSIQANTELGKLSEERLLDTLLKMPDVFESKKQAIGVDEWYILFGCIKEAVALLDSFRSQEGERLYVDISSRVDLIESYVTEVEKYEKERTDAVKQRLNSRIQELGITPDQNRLEQEIIFYIEKLDINEEKVRLRQHCKYFRETIDNESLPGKKLGFIAQEMGREINTMGSKANHAEIQKWVVMMKDELEKLKEQSLNLL
ncbi:MAG: YicC family protein [Bacteroidales bacterium]|nr:YicC family protein [Bacteroidales bacterium]